MEKLIGVVPFLFVGLMMIIYSPIARNAQQESDNRQLGFIIILVSLAAWALSYPFAFLYSLLNS